jgi:hypothetical protein
MRRNDGAARQPPLKAGARFETDSALLPAPQRSSNAVPHANRNACRSGSGTEQLRPTPQMDQAAGGKNTSVRTSMLSRGGASGANGFSNEVWNDSRARPSLALSWTRISSTSSVCISEK